MQTGKKPQTIRSSLVLLLTAFIWGIAFVAQRVGMGYIGPFLFAGLRFWLGALSLAVVLFIGGLINRTGSGSRTAGSHPAVVTMDSPSYAAADRTPDTTIQSEASGRPLPLLPIRRLVKPGVVCGCFLFMGGTMQQVGMVYTSASKAGFLTALYIVLVPVLGVFIGQKTHWNAWMGVVLAVFGLYFLSITEALTIMLGDIIVILGAFFWAGHILSIDRFVGDMAERDVLGVCVVQFFFTGSVALVLAPFLDRFFVETVFSMEALSAAALPIVYAGVMSTGVAFTLQAIGQQGLPPAAAAIIMSLEAVFSVLGGVVLLGEVLSVREVVGCALMFIAVIVAQLPLGQHGGRNPIEQD